MAFDAGAIVGSLGLNAGGFTAGILQAQSLSSLFPSVITNFMANPLLGIVGIAKSAGNALAELFSESSAHADNMGELAQSIGVSVSTLDGMGLVAGLAGAGVDSVGNAYKFLGKNAAEAAQGNKTLAADFKRLGVEVTDAGGKVRPLEDLMFDVADAIAALPPGAERTNAAMSLLGRSGTEMVPMFAGGSAAIKEQIAQFISWGSVVTDESAKTGGAWEDTMGLFGIRMTGLKNQLAEPLRTSLLPMLENLSQWTTDHMPEIKSAFNTTFSFIKDLMEGLGPVIKGLITGFRELQDWVKSSFVGDAVSALAEFSAKEKIGYDPYAGNAATLDTQKQSGYGPVNLIYDPAKSNKQLAEELIAEGRKAQEQSRQEYDGAAQAELVGKGL